MKLIHKKKPLPRCWAKMPGMRGLVLEKDIGFHRIRLRAKLLVFERQRDLRHFWLKLLNNGDLSSKCLGAVNRMITEVIMFPSDRTYLEADPRYFCIIGLIKNKLTMEIVTHESVHAAFAYAKRVRRTPFDAQSKLLDEESVCYPAGRIAAEIVAACQKAKLL